jgi:hypothetical protein
MKLRAPRRRLSLLGLLLVVMAPAAAGAATLKATLITPDDDPRLERSRVERAYLGHSGGPAADGLAVALQEAQFELEAAGADVKLDAATAAARPCC